MARILIVDDEEPIRFVIKEFLSAGNHDLYTANGAKQAFDVMNSKKIDLAIVDRNMPGVSGIEVVRMMRLNPKFSKIKVLMCTGSSVTREIDEAFSAGADDYILKPINFDMFNAKIEKVLLLPPKE